MYTPVIPPIIEEEIKKLSAQIKNDPDPYSAISALVMSAVLLERERCNQIDETTPNNNFQEAEACTP
jgi:hypothetical protein